MATKRNKRVDPNAAFEAIVGLNLPVEPAEQQPETGEAAARPLEGIAETAGEATPSYGAPVSAANPPAPVGPAAAQSPTQPLPEQANFTGTARQASPTALPQGQAGAAMASSTPPGPASPAPARANAAHAATAHVVAPAQQAPTPADSAPWAGQGRALNPAGAMQAAPGYQPLVPFTGAGEGGAFPQPPESAWPGAQSPPARRRGRPRTGELPPSATQKLVQKGYYLTDEQVRRLGITAVMKGVDRSTIVREALDRYFAAEGAGL